MKKIIILAMTLGMFAVFTTSALAGAGAKVEVSPNGEIRLAVAEYQKSKVSVSLEAQKYPQAWKKVFKDRSLSVPVDVTTENQMVGLFHYTLIKRNNRVVSMDSNSEIIVNDKVVETKGPVKFAWFILLSLFSILAMVVFNFTVYKGIKEKIAATTAASSAFIATITVVDFSHIVALFFVITTITTVIAGLLYFHPANNSSSEKKRYIIFSIIFYSPMFFGLASVYY